MDRLRRSLAGVAALLVCGAASLAAQHPQVRNGFWIGFGLGYGPFDASCSGCGPINSESGFTAHIRLGGTLKPNLLLGGDIVGWAKSQGGVDEFAGNTSAAAYFYPMVQSGFFLKGGVGFASYNLSGGGNTADGTGVGLTLGAGYDIRVGRNVSITPVGNFLFGSVGDIQHGGSTIASGWKQTILELGLDVTFH